MYYKKGNSCRWRNMSPIRQEISIIEGDSVVIDTQSWYKEEDSPAFNPQSSTFYRNRGHFENIKRGVFKDEYDKIIYGKIKIWQKNGKI